MAAAIMAEGDDNITMIGVWRATWATMAAAMARWRQAAITTAMLAAATCVLNIIA